MSKKKTKDEPFDVDVTKALEILGIKRTTLIARSNKGLIKSERRGKGQKCRVYFRKSDLEKMKANPPRRGRPPKDSNGKAVVE